MVRSYDACAPMVLQSVPFKGTLLWMSFFSLCILHFSQLVPMERCQHETPSSTALARLLMSPGSGWEKARAGLKLDTKISHPSERSFQYPSFYVSAFNIKSISEWMEKTETLSRFVSLLHSPCTNLIESISVPQFQSEGPNLFSHLFARV